MSPFEKRITDDQVASARERIAAGATLRATAAAIPCAPSTLSYRIKKAEEAEAAARRDSDAPPEPARSRALGESTPGDVGPLEIIREALHAKKAGGEPDWATRLSAARTLAALRPQELEPRSPEDSSSEILVYDLPPGAHPVIHRPQPVETDSATAEPAPSSSGSAVADDQQRPSDVRLFYYRARDSESPRICIGQWVPQHDPSVAAVQLRIITTEDPGEAERWKAELSAGRVPVDNGA